MLDSNSTRIDILRQQSYFYPAQKLPYVNTLIHRAVSLSQPDNFQIELYHVKDNLENKKK